MSLPFAALKVGHIYTVCALIKTRAWLRLVFHLITKCQEVVPESYPVPSDIYFPTNKSHQQCSSERGAAAAPLCQCRNVQHSSTKVLNLKDIFKCFHASLFPLPNSVRSARCLLALLCIFINVCMQPIPSFVSAMQSAMHRLSSAHCSSVLIRVLAHQVVLHEILLRIQVKATLIRSHFGCYYGFCGISERQLIRLITTKESMQIYIYVLKVAGLIFQNDGITTSANQYEQC